MKNIHYTFTHKKSKQLKQIINEKRNFKNRKNYLKKYDETILPFMNNECSLCYHKYIIILYSFC